MGNGLDFQRLQAYVGGVVDRKIKAISISVNSSVGYLKQLVTDSTNSATASRNYATDSQNYSNTALGYANTTMSIWYNFTSLYLGLQANDPQLSSVGRPVTIGGIYLRSSDKRLRVATAINNGVVTWEDAQLVADPTSVLAITDPKYVQLAKGTLQNITGPITFVGTVLVPAITDTNSRQAAAAVDIKTAVTTETTRATNQENAIITLAGQNDTQVRGLITNETNRALAAEAALGARLDSNGGSVTDERTRAISAEGALDGRITAEVNRATNAEGTLDGKITTERNRALAVEGPLRTDLSNEISRAQGAESGLAGSLGAFIGQFSYGSNERGYWEIRPGVIELFGRNFTTATGEIIVPVILPLRLPNVDYVVTLTPIVTSAGSYQDLWTQLVRTSLTTDGFSVQYQSDDNDKRMLGGFHWRVWCIGNGVPFTPANPNPNPYPDPGGNPGGNYGGGGQIP